MSALRISIAMATYNGERFLQEQLDSLVRQKRLPYELVVCDDGSSDATVSILKAFAETAPFPVRIFQNDENLGYGDNFLKATSLCEGEWIAFCDQDDVWLDHKLARYEEVIVEHPEVVLISHSAEQVDADLQPLSHRIPDHRSFSIIDTLGGVPLGCLTGFTCCIEATLIHGLPVGERPSDLFESGRRQAHDRFVYHVADAYGRIALLPETLAYYRRHEMAATGQNGSPVYDQSLLSRLRSGAYAREEGFRRMARQARQYEQFYLRILKHAPVPAVELRLKQTRDAARHYQWIAQAYELRADIYSDRSGPIRRARLLARNVRRGAYTSSGKGRGLGLKALAKDTLRTMITW